MIIRKAYFFCYIFFLWLNLLEACRASRKSDQDHQSCEGKCWQNFNRNDPCHCNSQCQNHNNCCDDFVDHCFTCQNKCGNSFNRNYGCQVLFNNMYLHFFFNSLLHSFTYSAMMVALDTKIVALTILVYAAMPP